MIVIAEFLWPHQYTIRYYWIWYTGWARGLLTRSPATFHWIKFNKNIQNCLFLVLYIRKALHKVFLLPTFFLFIFCNIKFPIIRLKNNIMVALVEKGDGSPAAALVADVEDQASVDSYSQVSWNHSVAADLHIGLHIDLSTYIPTYRIT